MGAHTLEPTKDEITGYRRAIHDLFGYMVVRALLPLIRVVSSLPRPAGVVFAVVLNAGTRLFDVVNYWGSRAAALVLNRRKMGRKLDRTIKALTPQLEHESSASLSRSMPFADRWDPFFKPVMTLHDVYAYPTQHFDFHARQLNLRHPEGRGRT